MGECTSKFTSLPPKFSVTPEVLAQFEQYAQRKNFAPQNSVLQKLREAKQIASLDKSNTSLTSKLEAMEKSLQKEQKLLAPANAKILTSLIENEVYSRFLLGKQQAEREVQTDRLVQSAAQILVSDMYEVKLSPGGVR